MSFVDEINQLVITRKQCFSDQQRNTSIHWCYYLSFTVAIIYIYIYISSYEINTYNIKMGKSVCVSWENKYNLSHEHGGNMFDQCLVRASAPLYLISDSYFRAATAKIWPEFLLAISINVAYNDYKKHNKNSQTLMRVHFSHKFLLYFIVNESIKVRVYWWYNKHA